MLQPAAARISTAVGGRRLSVSSNTLHYLRIDLLPSEPGKRRAFVHSNVIRFVALDLILRLILGCMNLVITFVIVPLT